jgi:flagellin-like hook-associated protein FlgL
MSFAFLGYAFFRTFSPTRVKIMRTPRLNHNSHLKSVHRSMAVHQADMSRQIGMLSSGLRINRPSDDPASALAMQGASSVFSDVDRLSINSEFNELRAEVDRIASATVYNGRQLLTGGNNLEGRTLIVEENDGLSFQVGPSETSNDVSRVGIRDMRATGPNLDLGNLSIVSRIDAQNSLTTLAHAIDWVPSRTACN